MQRKPVTQSAPAPAAATPARSGVPWRAVSLSVAVLALLAGGVVFADWWACLPDDAQPTYVGRSSCAECHQDYVDLWRGSHHDLAMDLATPESVLGDFSGVEFEHQGIRSRMFQREGKYWVHTEGPDGAMADFEVKYVFGCDPLQQYMVEFDRSAEMPESEVARVQVLRICWDVHRREWFYLPPPDVPEKLDPSDELHWTGVAQRWNNMCADCHSTNLQKNFSVQENAYHTTFSEIDVSCETCHGPASLHVDLARSRSLFWDRKRGFGLVRLKDSAETQIHSCAPCHSRRRSLHNGFRPGDNYYDCYDNELLMQATYHADGQVLDEDYVYGSFIQSRMYHQGIRCSDCHDPHTLRIKHEGNLVCTSCHQHPAGKYDTPAHHHHQPGSPGAACAECHMPESTYMVADPRRDHSIRNPRPDLSLALGTPNACTRCHVDKQAAGLQDRHELTQYQDWIAAARRGEEQIRSYLAEVDQQMADACAEWYGQQRRDDSRPSRHFSFALDAAWKGAPEAEAELIRAAGDAREPAIVRASALAELGQYSSVQSVDLATRLLEDASPQVRSAAAGSLQGRLREEALVRALVPRLSDPVRLVRAEAARVLAGVPGGLLRGADRQLLQRGLDEYEHGILISGDRAGAHMQLGILRETLGDEAGAAEAYRTASRIEPQVTGPRTNLAALYDRLAEAADRRAEQAMLLRNPAAEGEARNEAARQRGEAKRLRAEELVCLARDARLMPQSADIQYRYGMLLYLHRQLDEAEAALAAAHRLEPNHPQFLFGLVLFHKELKDFAQAVPLARRLVELRPRDPLYRQVLEEILQLRAAESADGS